MENVLVNFDNFKRTWSVKAELPISFTVKYSSDIFNTTNQDLLSYSDSQRRLVVIDKTVYEIYKTELHNYFDKHKVQLELFVLDAIEENKDWKHTDEVLKFFERVGVLRREPIVAIGGGVLLDLVGFCCSIYRRGIPYIKIPTTLLAIVDASVGVKVAANHLERRNRIGAYYPPIATFLDKKFIKTQNDRDIINGIAEIFKLAVIKSEELFVLLEENYEQLINEKFQFGAVPVRVINLAITGMIEELAPNLWEKKLDRCVDFGHSFGPLIEMQNLPNLYHGEAVVLDCLYSSCIAEVRGYITMDQLRRIFKCAKNLKLPTWHQDFSKVRLLESALEDTKKHRNGNQYLPVPMGIGQYTMLNNVTVDELRLAADLFEEIEA
jgi:3-dehydroquinate synthase